MIALAALVAEAHEAGIEIAVDGDDLLLTAPAQPPTAIIEMMARHKAELIALLRPRHHDWAVEDWQAYFDERAAIFEYEGGALRPEAEARALDCCVAEWLRRYPIRGAIERCLGCGGAQRGGETVLFVFGGNPAGLWLHSRCWPAWNAHRSAEARSALAAIGIGSPVKFQEDFGNIGED